MNDASLVRLIDNLDASLHYWHLEAWTQWPKLCRQNCQVNVHDNILDDGDSQGCNWQQILIDSGLGLAPQKWPDIT